MRELLEGDILQPHFLWEISKGETTFILQSEVTNDEQMQVMTVIRSCRSWIRLKRFMKLWKVKTNTLRE